METSVFRLDSYLANVRTFRMACLGFDIDSNCDVRDPLNEYWIGLEQEPPKPVTDSVSQKKEDWRWVDGSDYHWMNWFEDSSDYEPSGGSGRARLLYEGAWSDKEEEAEFRYICERGS